MADEKTKARHIKHRTPSWPLRYVPRVIVKFNDVPYNDPALKYDPRRYLDTEKWAKLLKKLPGLKIERLFTALSPLRIRDLVIEAERRDSTYHAPNFLTYFRIRCPSSKAAQVVAEALRSWETVQVAYLEGPRSELPQLVPPPDNNPYYKEQKYLLQAPLGIDAQAAWDTYGGDGGGSSAGLRFVDLEKDWNLDHQDLRDHMISGPIYGVLDPAGVPHGTAVLGVVAAVNNDKDCVGITPNVETIMVGSILSPTIDEDNIHDAILAAIPKLAFGDVLLLEVECWVEGSLYPPVPADRCLPLCDWYGALPAELKGDAIFDIIKQASAQGIIVVEAAGNRGFDLDTFSPQNSSRWGQDSGAIMVAGASSEIDSPPPQQHKLIDWINYGSRINCYAWGEYIWAIWSDRIPYVYFNGTSGSSAIIAGVVLAVQGVVAAKDYRLSPVQMRKLLSDWQRDIPGDPTTGNTLSARSTYPNNPANPLSTEWNADKIGVMPNLRAIIPLALNLAPDIYIRDNLADTGVPHTGSIASSPDIILLPISITGDPNTVYGEGSGNENRDDLSADAVVGQDNYIYVRARNLGPTYAQNVIATVYWSPPATLVTPDLWKRVGPPAIIRELPVGTLKVSEAVTWSRNEIPGPGHYCFVALIGNRADPQPDPVDFLTWDNFCRFIRDNNNVSWRNFDVVDNQSTTNAFGLHDALRLPFLITGPHNEARRMRLEVLGNLPSNAEVILQVPLVNRVFVQELGTIEEDEQHHIIRVRISTEERSRTSEILFPEKLRIDAVLLVHIPERLRRSKYELYVRQVYNEQEVGRITWRLVPGRHRAKPIH